MQREFSTGGIVFNKKLVLIRQSSDSHYWNFPKGHLGKGETGEQAALREVKEETGIEAEIIGVVGESDYIFTFDKEKVLKHVKYFLMDYVSGDVKDHNFETLIAEWSTIKEALEKLSFPADKTLLKKAIEIWKEYSSK